MPIFGNSEREIRESKEYLENIFKTSADGIIASDFKGTITMANAAAETMLGYSKGELTGKHLMEFSAPGKEHEERGKELIRKLFEDGVVVGFENPWLKKDGSLVDFEINATLLKDAKGTVTGAVSSIRDTSQRKRTEREIREARDDELLDLR